MDLSHSGVAGFVFESVMGVPTDSSKRLCDAVAEAVNQESLNDDCVPTLEARLPNRLDPWTADDTRQYGDLLAATLGGDSDADSRSEGR